ncbi:MAG TPA: integrase arm-type DNA-binding domain-containing protein [Saccharospirillum sp.]|nr:integrase arm-type DNA-binding domain-containing protein [Saccharospirillum sp.]
MPRKAKELSAVEVKGLVNPGFFAVGGVSGLHLQVTATGARSWIIRTMVGAKRRDIGLGGFPDVPLAQARVKAREIKELISQGIDPVTERKVRRSALIADQAKAITFEILASEYVAKKAKEFKTTKQVQRLEHYLGSYAYPYIGKMVVGDIDRAHIVKMLEPIWDTKTETASRVRLNVERILDLGGVKGLRSGDNPARWKGNLEHSFAARDKIAKVQHYKALPVREMPIFWAKLKQQMGMGARALEFLVLTAARSGEIRGATWQEIDLERRVWTIPDNRMKAGKEHRIPLSDAAMGILRALPRESDVIFHNNKGRPLSDVMISKVPKTVGYQVTAHGFRSTFKDWCGDHTTFPDEISELALAHVNSDKTRVAYARSDAFEKRRRMMAEWADFCLKLVGSGE